MVYVMKFEDQIIDNTVSRLLKGEDYRYEVINSINAQFLDFSIQFFKDIVAAKFNFQEINLLWYKKNFILNNQLSSDEIAIYSGINKKTITNICGGAKKDIVVNVAEVNFKYLTHLIRELEEDPDHKLNIQIKITYNDITVELALAESLLVLNALATKKIAIRGGAWSSIGKRVEKPLMIELCRICKVDPKHYNADIFKKDKSVLVNREVDFKLYSRSRKEIRCEVKLMGKGNPESADAVIARDSDVFIADTLSSANKKQLESLNIEYLSLKDNNQETNIRNFIKILDKLDVPYER